MAARSSKAIVVVLPATTLSRQMASASVLRTALCYNVVIPNFDPAVSGYAYAITVKRHNRMEQVLCAGQKNVAALAGVQPAPSGRTDYDLSTLQAKVSDVATGKTQPQTISGEVMLRGPEEGGHDIVAATLHIVYYPDRMDDSAFAELTIQESL
ncbi:hypothetical protein [Caballeronia sp. RCC_10]|uniref:hypothetical protein n=1 Tax=Caballeronia sp. RCC_10 TaxID=3239227 RepID=UPI00352507C6